ncbi:hypothetical protein C8A01DRAFT_44013 [Parachaetomium inaequale]|uniref:GTPase-activating protein GYP7 n=1 Tax=Parachaetomium inaequale TaxID=2588326 RepID=A0AAN6PLE8_9PEZI|nr:hypothetical protein C8A01DRAFT_44013 [Parachaetomium inaequale]
MASWYKGLLTNASSNISKLQRTYFGGESDGDTDDDTHVCRVLRGYYSEKGQPLPGWLPPDPKAPPPQQPVFAAQQQQGQGRYGGMGQGQQGQGGGGGGGLSSLWGDNNNNAGGQQQRSGQLANNRNPFAGGGGDAGQRPGMGGQRAGSYQPPGSGRSDAVSPAGSGSAQEKLKQRLWGGARTTSPNAGGPFQPPAQQQQQQAPAQQSGNRWGWGNQGSGGGSGDGSQGARRTERPVMSANAPWADGGFDYPSGGSGGGGGQGGGRGYGLPSGPRGGLPTADASKLRATGTMTRITKMTSSPTPNPEQQPSSSQHTSQQTTTTTTTSSFSTISHPPRPASPAGSFYAMSDDEEGGYDTITHTETGRGVKLLFSKSKVYIHPTPSARDNIAGYIALLQQKHPPASSTTTDHDSHQRPASSSSSSAAPSDLLLAWLPESQLGDAASIYVKVDLCDTDSPPRQSYLVPPPPTVTTHPGSAGVGHYAFAVPVSAVYSLLVRPPSVGWWYGSVIINSRAGDSFPPLFFHDNECQSTILQKRRRARDRFDPFGEGGEMFWGGDEVLRWLKRYVPVERSVAEPNVYLVEPSEEDSLAFGGKGSGDVKTIVGGGGRGVGVPGSSRGPAAGGAAGDRDGGMDPFMKFVKETGWNIMEKFSKVTTFTRQAAQDVLDNPRMPPQVRRLLRNPEVQTLQDEFDSARIYLARWAMGIAEQGERDRNQRIWTAREVMELEDTDVGEFELLDSTSSLTLEQMRKPVTLKEWKTFFDPRTGRLSVTVDEVKERVFHGGLDPDDGVRKEAWLFLLGVYEWYSTADERKAQAASLRDAYIKLKGAWWERQIDKGGEGEEGEWWREQRGRIEKDVHRTDRNVAIFAGEDIPHPDPDSPFAGVGTNVHMEQLKDMLLTYNEYNRDLGYVQGMSDLLAPIYAVLQDDAMAFWAFKCFMDRMERNFLRDQSGMRAQLRALDHLVQFMDPKLYAHLESADSTNFFFFFRMLLVWYKREFDWPDVLHLWEVLWTDYLSSSFHLFVALAILEKHRDVIMTHLKHFDEVLKYINELSCTIDLDSTLIRAEALFKRFQRFVDAVDKKGNFPAPRQRIEQAASEAGSSATAAATGTGTSPPAAQGAAGGGSRDTGKAPAQQQPQQQKEPEKVLTPELRKLLSRQVEVLPRKEVAKKGDGLAGTKGK